MGFAGSGGAVQVQQALGVGGFGNPQRKPECSSIAFTGDKAVKAEDRSNGKIEELLHS